MLGAAGAAPAIAALETATETCRSASSGGEILSAQAARVTENRDSYEEIAGQARNADSLCFARESKPLTGKSPAPFRRREPGVGVYATIAARQASGVNLF